MSSSRITSLSIFQAIFVFLVFGYARIFLDLLDGSSYVSGVDDQMRFFQIRDLFFDGQWFDMQMPFIAMPEPYFSPWSRLVDLPYVALAKPIAIFASADTALTIATWIIPPALLILFAWIAVSTARDIVKRAPTIAEVTAMVLLLGISAYEFSPGRIDHHSFQLLACMALAKGLVEPKSNAAAAWLGVGTVVSVCVGLEAIPIIILVFAIVGFLAAAGDRLFIAKLQKAGIAIMLSTPPMALVFLGVDNILAIHCDAFSQVWISALIGGGLIVALTPIIWARFVGGGEFVVHLVARLFIAGLAVGLLMGALWLQYPICSGGPHHMIDEISRDFWLDNIPQEDPGFRFFVFNSSGIIGLSLVIALLLSGVCGLYAGHQNADKKKYIMAICFLTGFSVLLTMLQARYVRFPLVISILLVPLVFQILGITASKSAAFHSIRRSSFIMVFSFVGLFALLSTWFADTSEPTKAAKDYMEGIDCKDEDFSVLEHIEPSIILAPFGMNYGIINQNTEHRLLAVVFHRSSPGIKRMAQVFALNDAKQRRIALDPVDLVVVCGRSDADKFEGGQLFRNLTEGRPPSGFEKVENSVQSRVLIYKVVHEKLEI